MWYFNGLANRGEGPPTTLPPHRACRLWFGHAARLEFQAALLDLQHALDELERGDYVRKWLLSDGTKPASQAALEAQEDRP
jgi:hypothetical protein